MGDISSNLLHRLKSVVLGDVQTWMHTCSRYQHLSIRCIHSFKLKCGSLPGLLRVPGIVMNEDRSVFVGFVLQMLDRPIEIEVVTCKVVWLVFALRLSICYCIPEVHNFLQYGCMQYLNIFTIYAYTNLQSLDLFAAPKS